MRNPLKSVKALSPVVAVIILIVVTVAVSIAAASWTGSSIGVADSPPFPGITDWIEIEDKLRFYITNPLVELLRGTAYLVKRDCFNTQAQHRHQSDSS